MELLIVQNYIEQRRVDLQTAVSKTSLKAFIFVRQSDDRSVGEVNRSG